MTTKTVQITRALTKILKDFTSFEDNRSALFRKAVFFLDKVMNKYNFIFNNIDRKTYITLGFSLSNESEDVKNIIEKWTDKKGVFLNYSEFSRLALLLYSMFILKPKLLQEITGIKDIIISRKLINENPIKEEPKKEPIKPKKFYYFYKYDFIFNNIISILYEKKKEYYRVSDIANILGESYGNTLTSIKYIIDKDPDTFFVKNKRPKKYMLNKEYIEKKIKELDNNGKEKV